jgi:nitrogen fixation protein FixH
MKRWVVAIVGLLAVNVIATIILATVANNGGTQVIPGYYDRAVHYDDAIAQAAHARALGWQVTTTANAGVLEVDVRDAKGTPVTDAHVSLTGYARAHASHTIAVELASSGQGRYLSATGATGTGWHDFALVIARGSDRLDRRVSIEAR